MLKDCLEIREIKSAKEIEKYLKEHEKENEFVHFVFEDKYTKNASLYVTNESNNYSFFYDYTLRSYRTGLSALDVYTREELAKELFERVQEEC